MNTKKDALVAVSKLRAFIPRDELTALRHDALHSEESQFFVDKLCEYAERVATMPTTYQAESKGDQAVVYLHYFSPSADWWITEKDMETPEEPGQHQAFGLADLGHGGELGYISIVELVRLGVELDLYFTPKTLAEIRKERDAA